MVSISANGNAFEKISWPMPHRLYVKPKMRANFAV
jgi:hypothetical protein